MRSLLCVLAVVAGCTEPPATSTRDDELLGLASTQDVIVTLDGTRATSIVANAVRNLGGGVHAFSHLPLVAARLSPAQIALVRALPGVRAVYPNRELEFLLAQSGATIGADDVHAGGETGSGIGVAVLDSGIDGTHADLTYPSKTVQNVKIVASASDLLGLAVEDVVVENLPDTDTTSGHGTHCAGVIAGDGATYRGIAPGAHLVGISTGEGINILWALSGLNWIAANHATYNIRVVNNSWGTTGAFDANDPINIATKRLHDTGITVVFAAGNEGSAQNTLNPYSVAPWVIGVAAGCKSGSTALCNDGRAGVLADFSSRGVPGDAIYHPTITAPGVRIVSARAKTGLVLNGLDAPDDLQTCGIATGDLLGYTCSSGTSMAAPHIAGVAALMLGKNPSLTPAQVKQILRTTAKPLLGYAEWEVGAGYVDAAAAVNAVP